MAPEETDKIKIDNLVDWLNTNGAETQNCEIRYDGPNNRGVYAAKDIGKYESVLFVPEKQIITLTSVGERQEICRQMIQADVMSNKMGELIIFAIYIILEMKLTSSQREFYPWIQLLPDNYDDYPLFFGPD